MDSEYGTKGKISLILLQYLEVVPSKQSVVNLLTSVAEIAPVEDPEANVRIRVESLLPF